MLKEKNGIAIKLSIVMGPISIKGSPLMQCVENLLVITRISIPIV